MALYQVTIKSSGNCNNIRFEKGMTVQVVTPYPTNPLSSNGGTLVHDAFMRIYGIDTKKAGLVHSGYLDVKQIG